MDFDTSNRYISGTACIGKVACAVIWVRVDSLRFVGARWGNDHLVQKIDKENDMENLEKLYTTQDLAELWQFDSSTVRRMFIDEPGVLKFGRENRRDGKRDYVNLRIPLSVAQRVYTEKLR